MAWQLLGGVFLGWSLGANDAANCFGTAVTSRMVRWRTAALLIAVFVLVGALVQGGSGLATYVALGGANNLADAFLAACAAAATVTIMTAARLPVSTSQAVVGAILGAGYARIRAGQLAEGSLNFAELTKVVVCWIGTPIGAAVASMLLFPALTLIFRRLNLHFLVYDRVMRWLLVGAGIYGAYALGANNVANVTGVFFGAGAFGDPAGESARSMALLVGGLSIGFGALTYSRQVMLMVGEGILPLDAFSSFIVVLSQAVTVHAYAALGVPVSTSQAVVGAVLGLSAFKGVRQIRFGSVGMILLGWVLTPAIAFAVTVTVRTIFP